MSKKWLVFGVLFLMFAVASAAANDYQNPSGKRKTCVDSDGRDITVQGIAYGIQDGVYTTGKDYCVKSQDGRDFVVEYYCKNGELTSGWQPCGGGCKKGACNLFCTDEGDNGNIYVHGYLNSITRGSTDTFIGEDVCLNDKILWEYKCLGKNPVKTAVRCPKGCFDGACKSTSTSTTLPNSCFDETAGDEGGNYYLQGVTSGFWNGLKFQSEDVCSGDGTSLKEIYCKGAQLQTDYFNCPCEDGACKSASIYGPDGPVRK